MTDFVAGISDMLQAVQHAYTVMLGLFALLFLTAALRFLLWAVFGAFLGEYLGGLAATVVSFGLAVAFVAGGGLQLLGGAVSGWLAAHTPLGQLRDALGQLQGQLGQLYQSLPF